MGNPQSIRVSKRMHPALDRLRPLLRQMAKESGIDLQDSDLAAPRIVEDALMHNTINLRLALRQQQNILTEIEDRRQDDNEYVDALIDGLEALKGIDTLEGGKDLKKEKFGS